jgi:hypothetical protein
MQKYKIQQINLNRIIILKLIEKNYFSFFKDCHTIMTIFFLFSRIIFLIIGVILFFAIKKLQNKSNIDF